VAQAEVVFHPEASAEYRGAYLWYAGYDPRAAVRFEHEVELAVERIEQAPNRWPAGLICLRPSQGAPRGFGPGAAPHGPINSGIPDRPTGFSPGPRRPERDRSADSGISRVTSILSAVAESYKKS